MQQRKVSSSGGGGLGARLKSFDLYRKVPKDLTEASAIGGTVSIFFMVFFLFLMYLEVSNFFAITEVTTIEIDHSEDGIIQVNFNITFPSVSCEFLAVDLTNVIGKRREDIGDKTVHKFALDGSYQGAANDDEADWQHLYEGTDKDHYGNKRYAIEMTHKTFHEMLDKFEVVLVDFHAPWCVHCRNLSPIYEHAADLVRQRAPHEVDGHHKHSVALATFDCTIPEHRQVCMDNHIQAFPTILVFRQSANNIVTGPRGRYYESYNGQREATPIADFAIKVLQDVQTKDKEALPVPGSTVDVDQDGKHESKVLSKGCRIDGYLMVQRVPGQIVIRPKSKGHSFNTGFLKMDHFIKHLSFGNRKPTEVRKLIDTSMEGAYAEKPGRPVVLAEGEDEIGFNSDLPNATFVHYLKVVSTTRLPIRGKGYHAYEYTINSNTHSADPDHWDGVPEVVMSYDLSPLKVQIKETHKPWIEGFTSACAILGGVYTCSVLFEAVFTGLIFNIAKKLD